MDPDIFDDRFQLCALRAFLEQAAIEHTMPPDSDATRQRAYDLYEQALAE
jgi:hypothetical protein